MLTSGQPVTLEDGTVVTPDMVSEKPVPTEACELVFLPDASYIESFVNENTTFHDFLQLPGPEMAFSTTLVYHATPMNVLDHPVYRQQFIYEYDGMAIKHVFDNSELNFEEYARPKAQ